MGITDVNLERCLLESATSHLRAIAAFRNIDVGENPSRAEVITRLREQLMSESCGRELIGELSACEREILFQLRDAGGSLPVSDMEKSWGGDDPEVARRWFWQRTVSRGLARLRLAGLLYCVRHPDAERQSYVFAEAFYDWLEMPGFGDADTGYAPYDYHSAGMVILSDMYHLLQYFDEYRVRHLQAGGMAKRHKPLILKKLNALTPVERTRDDYYVDLLFGLADAQGFIVRRRNSISVSQAVERWFERTPVEQTRDLYQAWLTLPDHDTAAAAWGVVVSSAGIRHSWERVKVAVAGAAGKLPDRWLRLKTVAEYFEVQRPYFYRPDHSAGLWKLTDRSTGEPVPADGVWNHLEQRIIDFILTQPMGWLGMVDTGRRKDGRSEGVILTDLGREILTGKTGPRSAGEADGPAPSALNRIVIQPDFEILAPAGIVLSVRDRLEKISERVSGGHIQKYRLSRSKVADALASGMTGDEILAFLESVGHAELPRNVRTSVLDWIGEFGKVDIQQSTILRAADAYLLQELMAQPALGPFFREQVGPETVLLDDDRAKDILSELKRAGYMPRMAGQAAEKGFLASISLEMDAPDAEYLLAFLHDTLRGMNGFEDSQHGNRIRKIIEKLEAALSD